MQHVELMRRLERLEDSAARMGGNPYRNASDAELIDLARQLVASPSGDPELDDIARRVAESHPAA